MKCAKKSCMQYDSTKANNCKAYNPEMPEAMRRCGWFVEEQHKIVEPFTKEVTLTLLHQFTRFHCNHCGQRFIILAVFPRSSEEYAATKYDYIPWGSKTAQVYCPYCGKKMATQPERLAEEG